MVFYLFLGFRHIYAIYSWWTDQNSGFIFIDCGRWSPVLRYLPFQSVFLRFDLTIVLWEFVFFLYFARWGFLRVCFCCFNINPLQKSRTRILFAYIYAHTNTHRHSSHFLHLFLTPYFFLALTQSALKAFVRFGFSVLYFCFFMPFVLIYFVVIHWNYFLFFFRISWSYIWF